MAAILQTTFSNELSWMNSIAFTQISLQFVLKSPCDYNPEMVQIMASDGAADKPSSETMKV